MTILRDIRRRLKSIENLKKITVAMERVAAARLRRADAKAAQSRPYITKMQEIVENLASIDVDKHPLFETRKEIKKVGIVIVAADKGLSGSYNSSLFSAAEGVLKKYKRDQLELILLGRKAIEHYRHGKWKVRHQLDGWAGKISFEEIKAFSQQLVSWFLSGEFDEIWLIYTHFFGMTTRPIVVEKFLNIEKSKTEKKTQLGSFIFEPNAKQILAELLPRYCVSRIQGVLQEAYAAELAARIIAMQTASKNSEEMLEHLTLVRNKIRQESITKEMIEIVSGAEAER